MIDTETCLNRRTLILGDVNTGKSRRTYAVLSRWTARNRSNHITVLDMAPAACRGIGGRMALPPNFRGRHLAADVTPPRLTAKNDAEAEQLAAANAAAIEALWKPVLDRPSSILIINDATLYLQAGDYERLLQVIQTAPTVLINAYYGDRFPDSTLTRRERRLTDRLIQDVDQVIWCS